MNAYTTSSRSYLYRADQRLLSGTPADLFYAAFELRCGVEARLYEYLEPHEFIPLGRKSDWRIGNLHRTIQESFRLGDQVARVRIRQGTSHLATLYHVPVTARLREIAERLGAYLHALKRHYPPGDVYWVQFRALLDEGSQLLHDATAGTLLGPLILDRSTATSSLPVEFVPDENGVVNHALRNLAGKSVNMDVSYHASLAEALTSSP